MLIWDSTPEPQGPILLSISETLLSVVTAETVVAAETVGRAEEGPGANEATPIGGRAKFA
jgi:hypothetical protein